MLEYLFKWARKKPRRQVSVILQCQGCKTVDTYYIESFRKAWLKEYLENGSIPQACDCRGNRNEPHKIVGLFTEAVAYKGREKEILRGIRRRQWE